MRKGFFLIGLIISCSGLLMGAQDLSQLAKKTRENRLKTMQQKSVRVWNNDNMPKAPAQGGPTAAGGMSAVTPSPNPASLTNELPPPEDMASEMDAVKDQAKGATQNVKSIEERLHLAEDELSLLEVQQASELSSTTQAEITRKVAAKKSEVQSQKQALEKAKEELENAEKALENIGGSLEEEKK